MSGVFAANFQWRSELRNILFIAWPLIINNIAITGMQFADTVMAGQLGANTLASVAVGSSVWFLGFSLCMGILMSVATTVARAYGARAYTKVGEYLRHGIVLAIGLGIVLWLVGRYATLPLLQFVGINESIQTDTEGYVGAIVWGAPALFMMLILRYTSEGLGHTRAVMIISLQGLVVNVILNYVLMFGHFGVPGMGAAGCGLASALTMWVNFVLMLLYMIRSPRFRDYHLFTNWRGISFAGMRELLSLGLPIAVMVTAELALFSVVSIMMGTFEPEVSAAHQIALNFASTCFMIPLALSSALTVRLGHLLGAERLLEARSVAWMGVAVCALCMSCTALIMLVFSDGVVAMYTADPAVSRVAVSLLFMAALFQIADGLQVGAAGALRGYKDTQVPMLLGLVAYWLCGFPVVYWYAMLERGSPAAVWLGFVVGLSLAALFLILRLRKVSSQTIYQEQISAQ